LKKKNRFDLKGKIKNYYYYYYLLLSLLFIVIISKLGKKIITIKEKPYIFFKKRLKYIRTWTDKLNIIINIINIIKFTITIITIEKNIDFDFKGKINFYYYINYYYY